MLDHISDESGLNSVLSHLSAVKFCNIWWTERRTNVWIFFLHICDLTSINSYFVHNISLEFLRIAEKKLKIFPVCNAGRHCRKHFRKTWRRTCHKNGHTSYRYELLRRRNWLYIHIILQQSVILTLNMKGKLGKLGNYFLNFIFVDPSCWFFLYILFTCVFAVLINIKSWK